jgi:hypothetical protein
MTIERYKVDGEDAISGAEGCKVSEEQGLRHRTEGGGREWVEQSFTLAIDNTCGGLAQVHPEHPPCQFGDNFLAWGCVVG